MTASLPPTQSMAASAAVRCLPQQQSTPHGRNPKDKVLIDPAIDAHYRQMTKVACIHCGDHRYTRFRYFNNKNAVLRRGAKPQARFACKSPKCLAENPRKKEVEFTHDGKTRKPYASSSSKKRTADTHDEEASGSNKKKKNNPNLPPAYAASTSAPLYMACGYPACSSITYQQPHQLQVAAAASSLSLDLLPPLLHYGDVRQQPLLHYADDQQQRPPPPPTTTISGSLPPELLSPVQTYMEGGSPCCSITYQQPNDHQIDIAMTAIYQELALLLDGDQHKPPTTGPMPDVTSIHTDTVEGGGHDEFTFDDLLGSCTSPTSHLLPLQQQQHGYLPACWQEEESLEGLLDVGQEMDDADQDKQLQELALMLEYEIQDF